MSLSNLPGAWRRSLALCLVLAAGCGDDSTSGTDASTEDASTPDVVMSDSAMNDAEPTDTSEPVDVTMADAGPDLDAGNDSSVEADVPVVDGGTPSLDGLVINELDPEDEWTELYNNGSAGLELGGYRITDSDDEGLPRFDRAATIPADFVLGPDEYLVAVEADEPELGVISMDCVVGARCVHTSFGLSAGGGDTVFVLMPDSDEVVLSAVLPADAVTDEQSFCRFPNATGDFQPCAPTAEMANALPEE